MTGAGAGSHLTPSCPSLRRLCLDTTFCVNYTSRFSHALTLRLASAMDRVCRFPGRDPSVLIPNFGSRIRHCDLDRPGEERHLFGRTNPLAHLEGMALDFAFIDGMHLSEFALRDFMNIEEHMDRAGVVVLDDVLPRNPWRLPEIA